METSSELKNTSQESLLLSSEIGEIQVETKKETPRKMRFFQKLNLVNGVRVIQPQKKRFSSFQKFTYRNDMNENEQKQLFKILKRQKFLKKFLFIVQKGKNINLRQALLNMRHLTSVTLINAHPMKDEEIKVLCRYVLNTRRKLKNLTLDFSNCRNLTNEMLNWINAEIGRKQITLRDLKLHLTACWNFDDEGIRNFSRHIARKLRKLQSLALIYRIIGWGLYITDEGFKMLAEQIGQNLKDLRHLRLHFFQMSGGFVGLSDKGMEAFATNIGTNLTKLQSLALNSASFDVSEEGVKILAEQIGNNLKSLKHFHFSLLESPFDDAKLKVLITQLGRLKEMKSLVLRFIHCRITDDGINALSEQLGNNLSALQYLELKFNCSTMTDEGMKNLASQIGENMKSLKNLLLTFDSCHQITDNGMKSLAAGITKIVKTLVFLKVSFHNCGGLSKELKNSIRSNSWEFK